MIALFFGIYLCIWWKARSHRRSEVISRPEMAEAGRSTDREPLCGFGEGDVGGSGWLTRPRELQPSCTPRTTLGTTRMLSLLLRPTTTPLLRGCRGIRKAGRHQPRRSVQRHCCLEMKRQRERKLDHKHLGIALGGGWRRGCRGMRWLAQR